MTGDARSIGGTPTIVEARVRPLPLLVFATLSIAAFVAFIAGVTSTWWTWVRRDGLPESDEMWLMHSGPRYGLWVALLLLGPIGFGALVPLWSSRWIRGLREVALSACATAAFGVAAGLIAWDASALERTMIGDGRAYDLRLDEGIYLAFGGACLEAALAVVALWRNWSRVRVNR
jgi:hypothetical protein